MQTICIIRDRGQLTIPGSIREIAPWVSPSSAVSIALTKPDEIVIKPHQVTVDWDKIWAGIKKSRAIKGTGNITAAVKFLETDRNSH